MWTETLSDKWLKAGRQAEIDAFYPLELKADAECEFEECRQAEEGSQNASFCDSCRQSQEEAEVTRILDEREDIDMHSGRLAVNVKLYAGSAEYSRSLPDDSSRKAYELASDSERDMAQEIVSEGWWQEAKEIASAYGLNPAKVWQEGRSGGWLIYDIDPESLSLDELRRFAAFSVVIKGTLKGAVAELAYQTVFYVRSNLESVQESVQAELESWAEEDGRDSAYTDELTEALSALFEEYLGEETE